MAFSTNRSYKADNSAVAALSVIVGLTVPFAA